MKKISVIIPTYNRFKYLLNAIKSVKDQTYKNIEIIVVNDGSTQKSYYTHDFGDVNIIHLEENTKKKFGFPCVGYTRTVGMKKATGKYIAVLDDDDIWFPNKLEMQINAMEKSGCKMSCTEGLVGNGIYNPKKKYKKFNSEHYYGILRNIYRMKGNNELKNGFPDIWNLDFLKIHNCIICSSVLIETELLKKINYMKYISIGKWPFEDYDCWLRALEHTDCIYVKNICFYYDSGHGDGQNHS
uniref:Glycosyl transferase family 2 n=1 Tax=Mimivirus LCMiAC02 TaxID=2506609 RepID=A0A481Z259_9VIRU|nr:MAG: glycosyl transferase family 2 [Mimivirus LCMiAC02]